MHLSAARHQVEIRVGDALSRLREMPSESADCIVTSPPYWGLRDYGVAGQIGHEPTPDAYVARLVSVFREARRVLRHDGTLWLNLGDSYAGGGKGGNPPESPHQKQATNAGAGAPPVAVPEGLKPKDLVGAPWRVALALQADGWFLRGDIIWAKPNPMPESVGDRPTRAHEYLFLLSKSARYYYEKINEPARSNDIKKWTDGGSDKQRGHSRRHTGFNGRYAARLASDGPPQTRNARSVWNIAPAQFRGAHFATMPPEMAARCIRAGCPRGGFVLDPFGGAGTTGMVAARLARRATLIELNPDYAVMARDRIAAEWRETPSEALEDNAGGIGGLFSGAGA